MAQGTAERALKATDVLAIVVDLTGATSGLDGVVEFDLTDLYDQGVFGLVSCIS